MDSWKARPWDRFPGVPVPLGSKIWPGMSGNGAWITSSNTNRRRKSIRAVRVPALNGSIAGGAGNRALPVCAQPREARMRQIILATILASGSFANAKNS